jgi:hypothetical protein
MSVVLSRSPVSHPPADLAPALQRVDQFKLHANRRRLPVRQIMQRVREVSALGAEFGAVSLAA